MSDTDQEREDEVLRRMLKTKPKPHKPKDVKPLSPVRILRRKKPLNVK